MKVIYFVLALSLVLPMAEARPRDSRYQATTDYINLMSDSYLPVFDCEIYRYQEDYNKCQSIRTFAREKAQWQNGGYALSCNRDINNSSIQRMCRELSSYVYSDSETLNCQNQNLGFATALERCFVTMDAYTKGYFDQTNTHDCFGCDIEPETVVVTPITPAPNYQRQKCYDDAYQHWRAEKQRKQEQGAAKTVVGTGLAIIGQIIANTSNTGAGQASGNILTGFGAAVAVYGLFEMSQANFTPPYTIAECRQFYRTEVRQVRIENRRCTTTRYYTSSWGRTQEYFETRCSTQTYYSFERHPDFWL